MIPRNALFCLFLLVLFAAAGCVSEPPAPQPEPATPAYVPVDQAAAMGLASALSLKPQNLCSWKDLRPGIEDNLRYIRSRPRDEVCVRRPGLLLTWGQLYDSVSELDGLLDQLDADPSLLAERFAWFRLAPGTLLTGYYEPWLKASLTPDATYKYPLYGVPGDLKVADLGAFHPRWAGQRLVYRVEGDAIKPYFGRSDIDGQGALAGKGDEIAWAADPVDVFFLQIQGSGRLDLADGTYRHILYGGKNGRQYVSIGRILIDEGYVPKEEMSMQRIRKFLNEHPDVAEDILFRNPSYVFFQLADEGPFGSINAILTPRVSVAVDRSMIPLGSVVALRTALMDYATGEADPFFSLVLAQDTGGAIQNTRMDLFCGTGEAAETLAGHLQEGAEVYMLLSRRVLASLPNNVE
ncbi:MltA domain protein [Pseudodesulfovibrio mercurii]|uniref:peptidoglycan lytic exotransglycosylase n=1 Tax=Pseudodesulfovibrio mercurii TaxID=641491 RepID=F0JH46_9BACT|nr:MltA domain-containing protein [Pseudodesulfovibrio mercurii]EGB13985.1 MltA domain protein [Pseudodesulfovibrio mercurii]